MANLNSKIEWTDTTWSPTVGCTKVSHCYAEGIARRFSGLPSFPNGFDLTLHPDRLDKPLHWRKPRRVFVDSMSDLFHQGVPDEFIAQVFAVMAMAPQHSYQILTKRHGRMRSLLANAERGAPSWLDLVRGWVIGNSYGAPGSFSWPLPNVWLGCSVEDQKRADLRIPALLGTPASIRFLSCEPLLGPVDLRTVPIPVRGPRELALQQLDWVIVGGESGPDARPMELDWARSLVEQCRAARVPVFVKQDSGPKPGMQGRLPDDLWIKEFPAVVPS
jgi:protein gp37